MEKWYQKWFSSEDYLLVYNHRDSSDAKQLTDLILNITKPNPYVSILDAACGAGRHAEFFISKGFKVVGFDLSMLLIKKAIERIGKNNANVSFVRADIREICFKRSFNLILNLFTSFAYFETDEENFNFIRKSKNFLLPNGFYVLDYFNIDFLKKNLIPESYREVNGISIKEKRKIENERVIKEITLIKGGKENRFTESVKLYDYKILVDLFEKNGYKLLSMFGNYDGSEFDLINSPRLILFFQI